MMAACRLLILSLGFMILFPRLRRLIGDCVGGSQSSSRRTITSFNTWTASGGHVLKARVVTLRMAGRVSQVAAS
ncbi:hypothetical protein F4823DRAFT_583960 [Ustulina deusta]|nr:hypothetical protein F4823DRAFT_583960 [Ustulina deusta]